MPAPSTVAVEVWPGTMILDLEESTANRLVARLPAAPLTAPLTLTRVADGASGLLDPAYEAYHGE